MTLPDLDAPCTVSQLGSASGRPVIVLPGGPCRGVDYLGDFAGLGESHALTVFHPRGTPTTGGHSNGWWADASDVITLADALGLDEVDIVAHSAGTRLAVATAARFPSRVRSMMLVTPPATWLTRTGSDSSKLVARASREAQQAFPLLDAPDPDTEAGYRDLFLRQAPASYARWGAVEREHARIGVVSLAAATAWFTGIPGDAAERVLDARLPPTLVVAGDIDLLTGVRPVLEYAARLGADSVLMTECGHYPWVEQPTAFRQHASAWLEAHGL